MTRTSAWAAAWVAVMVGCAGEETTEPASGPPHRDARITLEIGDVASSLERSFGRVSGVAMDEDGRIHVADQQAHALRVFGPDGTYLFSIGREGQGPGELVSPCCLGIEADVLWLRDNGNRRLSAYRLHADSASYVESRLMAHTSVGSWASTFSDGDVVYDVGVVYDDEGRGMTTLFASGPDREPRAVAAVLSLEPQEYGGGQTVEVRRGTIVGRAYFQTPFGPSHLIAFGPGELVAEAVGSSYSIALWTSAGDTTRVAVPGVPGPPISERERAVGEERLATAGERIRSQGASLEMSLPERKPPLEALWFDREGRLWVERSVADGAPREADVYDAAGTMIGRRRWPADIGFGTVGWIQGDVGLGVGRDSLGVERVVRVEWTER